MNEQKQHSGLKKWSIRVLWVCLAVFAVGLVLRLSLKTDFVQNQMRSYIVNTANSQLNAELSIEKLSGDLWREVTLSGIALNQEDTVAQVDSIHASYNVWPLIGGQIEVSDLQMYQTKANLHQEDGRWNIQDIMLESSDTDTSATAMMSFDIGNFALFGGTLSINSDSLPVGSTFSISDLQLASSLGYGDDGYAIDLDELSFRLESDISSQPVTVQTAASAQQQQFSLEKLVVAAGESVIRASAKANTADSALQFDLSASPISWQSAADYVQDYPVREDLDVTLSLSGKPEQFDLAMAVSGSGLREVKLSSQFLWQSDLIIRQLQLSGDEVDLATLMADTTYPRFKKLDATFDGSYRVFDSQSSKGDFQVSMSEVIANPYELDQFLAEGTLDKQNVELRAKVSRHRQLVDADLEAQGIWDTSPLIMGVVSANNINPGFWLQDTTYNGDLTFQAEFTGREWYPQKEPWTYGLQMGRGTLMGQPIMNLDVGGQVSANDVVVDGILNIRDGAIEVAADLRQFSENPTYNYEFTTSNFDFGALMGQQDFPTDINSTISGHGRGFDPSSMELETSVIVDSSIINGEPIRQLSANLSVDEGIAKVDSAQLRGTIADGEFDGRMNLLDYYDLNNELVLDLQLKDLSALAPLTGADSLQAMGPVTGTLSPSTNKDLRFLGTLEVADVMYDDILVADGIRGSVDINLGDQLRYLADIDMERPSFSGVQLQRINLITKGDFADRVADGQYDFRFSSPNEGRIEQSGNYYLTADSARIQTNEFSIISDYRTLTLEESFELRYQNSRIQMDTMRVSSGDGAFLEMGLPILCETEQNGFIRAKALNTAVIQSSIFDDSFFKGMLSGEFEIDRIDSNLKARGELLLSELSIAEAELDSLKMSAQILDERLQGDFRLHNEGKRLAIADADLPFKLGDPKQFEESFFKERVSGNFRMQGLPIEQFQSLFDPEGVTQTSGIFSFWGTLGGTAGDPEFDVDLSLKNAMLSGVAIDSVVAGGNYRHVDEQLTLDASVLSLGQRAAQISAAFPLFIDMKTFQVNMPQEDDNIVVDIETKDFNLKALNDFVDPLIAREIAGRLDGMIRMKGTMEDPRPNGHLELKRGAFRLVPAGIRVDNIAAIFDFEPDQIRLSQFSAQSGKGNLKANGTVGLDKLVPGDLDITINGENFRAANTNEYNAVVNTKARAEGSITKPKVTGNLDFLSGFFKLDNFGEKSVETVRLDSLDEPGPSVSLYDSLALDMDIGFNERFFIQNERYLEMEVELDGELDLAKNSGEDVQLFGSMNAASGYALPFGKEFDIEEGVVTFSGNPENPQVNIRSRYEPPQTQEEIIIWYIIEGTVEDPKFRYESQPPMELENIISYTLFGQPFYALDSWKQVVASSGSNTTAADVALDVLLDRVETLATQQLGIDVVKIDNTRSGGEAGTSITTGWYLNPKVFFAIQNVITGSTPETGFLLEYMLRKDLKLILRQGNNIRQGVDLRWNYDY